MKRIIPLSAAVWEVFRFFLLVMVMTVQLNTELRGEMSVFLLWISVVSLVAAAALFFAGTSPERYMVFVPLVVMLKVLQLLFGVILILYIQGVVPAVLSIIRNEVGSMQGVSMLASSLPAITGIVAVDFLFALFLGMYILRYSRGGERESSGGKGASGGEELPGTEIISVGEEE